MSVSKVISVLLLVFLFNGGAAPGHAKSHARASVASVGAGDGTSRAGEAEEKGGGPKKDALLKEKFYAQYKEWRGVSYRLGGLSKRGIDCSGFVYMTFKTKLGLTVPRTTEMLARSGRSVARERLKAGDLVFFKTSYSVRHVGIYLEGGRFLHASKSRGVMISRLDNVYWKRKYWQARRLDI